MINTNLFSILLIFSVEAVGISILLGACVDYPAHVIERFVEIQEEEFQRCGFRLALISACKGHKDIACVVFYHCLDDSISWLNKPIAAFDGKIPCEEIEKGNGDDVRELLWRMP